MDTRYQIQQASVSSPDAVALLSELSQELSTITGSSGNASFDAADLQDSRARFVVLRDADGTAVGCGAFRPMDDNIAEIKRVYARVKHSGVGATILHYLEQEAARIGFSAVRLETRVVNRDAVEFYLRNQYRVIPNFGQYAGRLEAICFEKTLFVTGTEEQAGVYESKHD